MLGRLNQQKFPVVFEEFLNKLRVILLVDLLNTHKGITISYSQNPQMNQGNNSAGMFKQTSINKASTTSQVNIHDLQKRFRSKKEMYEFMIHDCKTFLPKLEAATIFFMKQITKAEKDVSWKIVNSCAAVYKFILFSPEAPLLNNLL
jgi:hypothetical protein